MLADEPTASLDAANSAIVIDLLRNYSTEANATLLIASHETTVISQFTNQLHLTKRGLMIRKIAWQQLWSKPLTTSLLLLVMALAVALSVLVVSLGSGLQRGLIAATEPFTLLVGSPRKQPTVCTQYRLFTRQTPFQYQLPRSYSITRQY